MKFSQIAVGQRFRWQGDDYVKINALFARPVGGDKHQLVPRYSEIEIPGAEAAPTTAPASFDAARVEAAFERFYAAALEHTDSAGREQLAAARREFLEAIGRQG